MHRRIAGTAASLFTALAIGAPLASAAYAAPSTVHCGSGATAAECQLLDDLASQLGPIAELLGTAAPATDQAQGLAARSDGAAGVPTAEVVSVSEALLDQLAGLPAPVQTLVGATRLGDVTDTLHALVGVLTAPGADDQQSSGESTPTPAKASTSSSPLAPVGGARSSSGTSSEGTSATTGASASSDEVPDVPVGDPFTLAPLALPDFGFDTSFEPVVATDAAAPSSEKVELAALADLDGDSRAAELAVVAILSVMLLAGAGVAQLQANRHEIPD
jgi:hypothetical protein